MDKLLFGAAYYDEYMPHERLRRDVEMMKRAGMNTVRIAESTWSTCEPQRSHTPPSACSLASTVSQEGHQFTKDCLR